MNFSRVVNLARAYFEQKGFQVYDNFPDDPTLPVDLYCEGNVIPLEPDEKEEREYEERKHIERKDRIFVLVCVRDKIPWQNRLSVYQYYLSKHLSPIEHRMALFMPHNSKLEEDDVHNYHACGFGVYTVDDSGNIQEVYEPLTLRERMILNFQNSDIAAENNTIKEKSKLIARFFDEYVHEVADILDPRAGRSYIDRRVLDNILELKHVKCGNTLRPLVNDHLSDKDISDYDFCENTTKKLWDEYVGIPYSNLLKFFDPILAEVVPGGRYRDHELHQFQVFLTGLYIIDNYQDLFTAKYKDPELSWLIAATSHDLAYPIQYYNRWTGNFFQQMFNTPDTENMGTFELKSRFIDQSFLNCLGDIIGLFKKLHFEEELTVDWLAKENKIIQFFHKRATEKMNHGVLQAFSLIKVFEKHYDKVPKDVIIPSALSVLLHHDVWKELREEEILIKGEFKKDPLTFLLIFCDCIQEWGRPCMKDRQRELKDYSELFFLKDFNCTSCEGENKVEVILKTKQCRNNDDRYRYKQDELTDVSKFLEQGTEHIFRVLLEDNMGNIHPCEMTS
jgi:hypothetical protein